MRTSHSPATEDIAVTSNKGQRTLTDTYTLILISGYLTTNFENSLSGTISVPVNVGRWEVAGVLVLLQRKSGSSWSAAG